MATGGPRDCGTGSGQMAVCWSRWLCCHCPRPCAPSRQARWRTHRRSGPGSKPGRDRGKRRAGKSPRRAGLCARPPGSRPGGRPAASPGGCQALAKELAASGVDVIVTTGFPASRAARRLHRRSRSSLPMHGDPVDTGLAVSLAHPGGNVTGISDMSSELSAKRLELLEIRGAGAQEGGNAVERR